ncbi:conserved exported protein of unknown function [Nitrospira sp. KM1]|uniref:DUF4168 domain-containing protein n=1 Tax=Nitrospira sp. KM1 TaxID=1936990 RepID=UPI0013A75F8B|nr:DUF4168 domain-containing protein [Nitrospira sp. KM1]BCA56500.1 conserved exported protein of unknown function [Nitrospira sp. KM1]
MNLWKSCLMTAIGSLLLAGSLMAAEPTDVERFVKARIEIGEMMTNYFKGGSGEAQMPSPDRMKEMRDDINAKVAKVLEPYGLTVEEYRARGKEVFADEAAVKGFLEAHPDLKQRYEALPLDRMGRGGSGRGY